MSGSSSRTQLLDQGLALGAYLEELLSEKSLPAAVAAVGTQMHSRHSATAGVMAAAPAQALTPEPAPGRLQVRVFQVAGLTLAVPVARVKDVVTSDARLSPSSEAVPLLLGVLSYPGGESRVVDTAALIVPQDPVTPRSVQPDQQAGQFVVLDQGRWALACNRIGDVIELQDRDVRWRTEAGKRPWLAGTVMKQMCALLDVDALIGLLAEAMA